MVRGVIPPGQSIAQHARLLDRDALGEVPRLVDVAAAEPGDVVGEQLERDDRHAAAGRPRARRGSAGRRRTIAPSSSSPSVPTAMTGPRRARTSSMLLRVLACSGPRGATKTLGVSRVDQGDRAVLHLGRRVALGVDVADLLELQGPFQGDRDNGGRGRGTGRSAPARSARRPRRSPARSPGRRPIASGTASIASTTARPSVNDRWRSRPRWRASRVRTITWAENALVLATPTSGPACR